MFLFALMSSSLALQGNEDLQKEQDRDLICEMAEQAPLELLEQIVSSEKTTPEQRYFVLCASEKLKDQATIYRLLDASGSSSNLMRRLFALQILEQRKEWLEVKPLMTVFLRSRFSSLPEDPDLFEHSARLLQNVPPLTFKEQLPHFAAVLLSSKVDQIEHNWPLSDEEFKHLARWRESSDFEQAQQSLYPLILQSWERNPSNWQKNLLCEEGTLIFDLAQLTEQLIHASWRKNNVLSGLAQGLTTFAETPQPATLRPGQYLDLPSPQETAVSYEQYKTSSQMPFGVGLSILFLIFLRLRLKAAAGLSFSVLILCCIEWSLSSLLPLKAETAPLFSFSSWQYQPFEETIIENKTWLQSRGGAVRWQQFLKHKPEEGKRIFVLGASSAHGSNHLLRESFSALLEEKWRAENPSQHRQIINFGIGGTTSSGVLYAGSWALKQDADGLIIYYGHNEAAQFSQLVNFEIDLSELKTRTLLSHSGIYSLLSRLISPLKTPLLDRAKLSSNEGSSKAQILQARALAAENFHWNIGQLLQKAQRTQTPVLLIKAVSNYRFAPSEPWDNESPRLREAAELASQQGQHKRARNFYQASIEAGDEISTSTLKIQEATVELAIKYGVYYLDAEELFYRGSPDGLSANELFWDELHPSKEGHRRLSNAIYPWLTKEIK